MRTYKNAGEVSFPLGGIGAGSIGLAADGRLVDWELFSRPNRQSINFFTHFAIRSEGEGIADCRVLQGDTARDHMGGLHIGSHSWGYGHGISRATMAGFRHFRDTEMEAFYPMAEIRYDDPDFPGGVRMTAFSPFIPSNDRDSSIPAAFFEFTVENTNAVEVTYTLALSCANPLSKERRNRAAKAGSLSRIKMDSTAFTPDEAGYGELVTATDCEDADWQESWYRSGWFDDLTTYWREFTEGNLRHRHYDEPNCGRTDLAVEVGTLTAKVTLQPGEAKKVRFLIAWYMPNTEKYWDKAEVKPVWKQYYASLFGSADDVAAYCFENWDRLQADTERFRDALLSSSLPEPVLDAIQGNIAILKSSTCLRLTDGSFYGWEGVVKTNGSCEGSCTHVWNYAYALPFLFPKLERSMRELDYTYNYHEDGKMSFRLMLPVGSEPWDFRACADGQMGGILKMYREWKLSGDDDFLKKYWPRIKKSLEYAWSPDNPDEWDIHKTGVMRGRQHHTLDVELFGPSSWLEGFYLTALKAAAEMADYLGEPETAAEYRELFEKGKHWTDEFLFTGTHYAQKVDLTDRAMVDYYTRKDNPDLPASAPDEPAYWYGEAGEIKYQIGEGSIIDQVLAAWHADMLGLGEIYDPVKRRKALETIYRENFRSMRDADNPCRVFCLDDEAGVIICQWPEGVYKPRIPVPYAEEVMCGFEYAAAGNMLQCGMEDEAVEIVRAIRDRYDGVKRNPWAEIECGASYARSMASYALLLIWSGFRFDMTRGLIGFRPLHNGRYFWSADGAWGTVSCQDDYLCITVDYGSISLKAVESDLAPVGKAEAEQYNAEGMIEERAIPFKWKNGVTELNVTLTAGESLVLMK